MLLNGPGKYDDLATMVRESTGAGVVLLAVTEGNRGSGFSVQSTSLKALLELPAMLREIADQIERGGGFDHMGHAEDLESYETAMRHARANWPEGPWTNEPDRIEWRFEGFPCLMVRSIVTGAWCGYVGVSPGHPLHGKDYRELDLDLPVVINYARACSGPVCHVPEPGAPDAVHWIGFDCAHAFDLYPAISLVLGKLLSRHHGRYRDKDEVRHLVTALALELKVLQLAAAGS